MNGQVSMTALKNIPMINESHNLSDVIAAGLKAVNIRLECNDILVICQKIVSKAEGRKVDLRTVIPSEEAINMAQATSKDPRLVELILVESDEVLRCLLKKDTGHLIVRHRLGFVNANAGIDQSNIEHDGHNTHALLLPENPMRSCQIIRDSLFNKYGIKVGIIINDSTGRPWRNGTTGLAIGLAGLPATIDVNGHADLFGRIFKSTVIGFADEVAAAASLLMGQSTARCPIIHIRGLTYNKDASLDQGLVRAKEKDLFV